jgi:hypothetical protein
MESFSSTMPSDTTLASIYRYFHTPTLEPPLEAELIAALRALPDTDLSLLIPHFPVLFNALLHVICGRSSEAAQVAFVSLVGVCARIHLADKKASEKRSGLVYQFVEFVFRAEAEHDEWVTPPQVGMMQQFLVCCLLMRKGAANTTVQLSTLASMSWMLFDFTFKAAVFAFESASKADVADRQKKHPSDFARVLGKLFKALRELIFNASEKQLSQLETSDLCCNMMLFLSEMMVIYDRGIICGLFCAHLQEFRTAITNSMGAVNGFAKAQVRGRPLPLLAHVANLHRHQALSSLLLDSVKLFTDNESFVPLNMPKPLLISKTAATLCEAIEEKHPAVAGVIIMVLDELLNNR